MGQLLEVRIQLTPCGQRSIEMQGHFLRIHWRSKALVYALCQRSCCSAGLAARKKGSEWRNEMSYSSTFHKMMSVIIVHMMIVLGPIIYSLHPIIIEIIISTQYHVSHSILDNKSLDNIETNLSCYGRQISIWQTLEVTGRQRNRVRATHN